MSALLTNLKLIAFDLDDTLYPEIAFVKSGFRAVAGAIEKKFSLSNSFYDLLWGIFMEGERKKTFDKALQRAALAFDSRLVDDMVRIYRTHLPAITLYPDAQEVLEYLRGRKKLGLITDGYLITQKNKVAALHIDHYFDLMVFTDEAGRQAWKPSVWGYKKMMEHFDLAGAECAYVGDNSLKDFAGAQSLAWVTFKIERTEGFYCYGAAGDEPTTDYTVHSLTELKKMFA